MADAISSRAIMTGNFRSVQLSFALTCLVALSVPLAAAGQTVEVRSPPHRLVIGMLALRSSPDDSSGESSSNGLTLGIEEAQRTGRLFGWEIVVVLPPDSLPTIAPLYLDLGSAPRRPHGECGDRAFRLLPSNRSAQPSTKADTEITTDRLSVVAWHPALERFGAAQLNERYRKRFGTNMDERAWASWLSIKVLLDAALRTGTSDHCTLERFFLSATGRFDGHKGVPLFFDPQTRELVQPLYAPRRSGELEMVSVPPSNDATSRVPGMGGTRCAPTCG